jgi:hypothetical protein
VSDQGPIGKSYGRPRLTWSDRGACTATMPSSYLGSLPESIECRPLSERSGVRIPDLNIWYRREWELFPFPWFSGMGEQSEAERNWQGPRFGIEPPFRLEPRGPALTVRSGVKQSKRRSKLL